jgi:hypothetical protein
MLSYEAMKAALDAAAQAQSTDFAKLSGVLLTFAFHLGPSGKSSFTCDMSLVEWGIEQAPRPSAQILVRGFRGFKG